LANIVEKNKESMKNKKKELILLYARAQRNHSQNAVSDVFRLQTKKQKIFDKFIFGFVEGHISHRKFTEAILVKSTTSLKRMD
jgi:hypothetical protein